ncbi:MAG: ABC transporter substrate-binding protein [Hungatella sp.]|nr:ABC transporter substrate-binding protein [Hungatella sp.]
MKRTTRKATALVMASVMMLGLTACGGQSSQSSGTAQTTAAKTETEAAKAETSAPAKAAAGGEKATVNFWHSMSGGNGELLQSIVDNYNASQDKVQVVAEYQGDYYSAIAKAQTAIAAGNGPDILQTGSGQVSILAKEEGILENLVPYMNQSGMEFSDFDPTFITGMSMDPNNSESLVAFPMGCSTPVMYCNMDILDAAGAEVPTSWAEMSELTKKLIADGVIEYGFAIPHDCWYFWMFVAQNDTTVFSDDGMKFQCVDDGTGIEAMQVVQDMCKDKVMYFGPVQDSGSTCRGMFLDGKCAFFVNSCADLKSVESNAGFNYSVQYVPKLKVNAVPSGGNTLTMLASAADKDAAWDFMHWLYTENDGVATFAANTGYLPPSKTIAEQPIIKEKRASNPNYEVAYNQLEHGNNSHMVMQPNNGDVANNITAVMEACFYDFEDVTERMTVLKEEVEDILIDLQ